jgi:hypothetical protein
MLIRIVPNWFKKMWVIGGRRGSRRSIQKHNPIPVYAEHGFGGNA